MSGSRMTCRRDRGANQGGIGNGTSADTTAISGKQILYPFPSLGLGGEHRLVGSRDVDMR